MPNRQNEMDIKDTVFVPDRMCGACGSTNIVDGYFYNKEKDIKLRLCTVCEKTAKLNGYATLL